MKITINMDRELTDTEIVINCPGLTPETERIIAALRVMESKITVGKDQEIFVLDCAQIAYVEAVDRKTFVYTSEECYETKLKLYEMEEKLCGNGFIRISKSCLVHLKYIKSVRNDVERRLRLTLTNGEQMIVSRQYADEFKKRLGVL